MVGKMCSYIFTEHERRLLHLWLEYGEESQSLRDLFTKIRANMTPIREDLELFNRVARRLQKERRFHGKISRKMLRDSRR
jgi:hypothetical protein